MRVLSIHHVDFTLQIECAVFDGVSRKAHSNLGDVAMQTSYGWSDGVSQVVFREGASALEIVQNDALQPPVFFDNVDYAVWVDFNAKPTSARVGTMLKAVEDSFSFHEGKSVLSGFLNFDNDIGKSALIICYTLNGINKTFRFDFEVLSSKLDYHQHWRKIVDDIEAEYRMLSIAFLRKTYHTFAQDPSGETPDLIWWNLFHEKQDAFIKACQLIISRPRRQVRTEAEYLRAEKLKRLTPQLENELAENRFVSAHLYRCETDILSHDTVENRFLKFALSTITRKHEILARRVIDLEITDAAKKEIEAHQHELKRLCAHPFFRSVGKFTGLNQESLVLQRATGYATIARIYTILTAAYSLKEGLHHLQTKDIATLYEIWCFIEIKNTVARICGETVEIAYVNRPELNRRFSYDLATGEQSRILFKKDNVELAELLYNAKTTESGANGILNTITPTGVAQKPDIILQLTRKLGTDNAFKLTYLFDAKYRIADRTGSGVDTPPDDAINQMHRYRDAIYYKEPEQHFLRKEVIGGYILFPGTGDPLAVQEANFYKSIGTVNIGAFPLRPCDAPNRELLDAFVRGLLEQESTMQLHATIPQKGTRLTIENIPDHSVFLLDAPVKGIQECAVKEGVYPAPISSTPTPELIEWIPLSLSNHPVRLLKVMHYIGIISISNLCQQYPSFSSEIKFTSDTYHLWKIQEISQTSLADPKPTR